MPVLSEPHITLLLPIYPKKAYTLINESLNGYGESPSNGFHWKVCIEWIVLCLKTMVAMDGHDVTCVMKYPFSMDFPVEPVWWGISISI